MGSTPGNTPDAAANYGLGVGSSAVSSRRAVAGRAVTGALRQTGRIPRAKYLDLRGLIYNARGRNSFYTYARKAAFPRRCSDLITRREAERAFRLRLNKKALQLKTANTGQAHSP